MDPSRAQFNELGAAYAASKSHATGATLQAVIDRAMPQPDERCCDVATGAGHMALAMAPHVDHVNATDIAAGMMDAARTLADERGVTNITWTQAPADALPFPDAHFDLVVSRTAAHHFPDLPAACREWFRITKPGGRCVVTDLAGYDDDALQAFVHRLEVLHDPSHVRSYPPGEWRAAFESAGFVVDAIDGIPQGAEHGRIELAGGTRVDTWTARSQTTPEAAAEIRQLLETAPDHVRDLLQVRGTGSELHFNIYKLVVTARVPLPSRPA